MDISSCALRFIFGDDFKDRNIIYVTYDDQVLCVGENNEGLLGCGHKDKITIPAVNSYLSLKKVIRFDKNTRSMFCLTKDGKIFGWGYNKDGQVGHGYAEYVNVPTLITDHLNKFFIDIKCGELSSLALTNDDQVYIWGKMFDQRDFKPRLLINGKVKAIHCTSFSYYAVLGNGEVYGWGDNSCGQLCLSHFDKVDKPTRIDELKKYKIKKISCGWFHVLMLDEDGALYGWGCNYSGQLGDRTVVNKNTVQRIFFRYKIHDIIAMNNTSYVVTDDKAYWVFGLFRGDNVLFPIQTGSKHFEIIKRFKNYKINLESPPEKDD